MPKPPRTKTSAPRVLYALLFLYIGIAGTYEIVAFASTAIVYFNLRNQVVEPFRIEGNSLVADPAAAAKRAGLSAGDTVLSINGVPFTGYALWHRIRWYAHPGETVRVAVRKPDGRRATAVVPLVAYPAGYTADRPPTQYKLSEAIFILVVAFCVPLFCLVLGSWVALARPRDPNAWFILVLLTYPQFSIRLALSTGSRIGSRCGSPGTWSYRYSRRGRCCCLVYFSLSGRALIFAFPG